MLYLTMKITVNQILKAVTFVVLTNIGEAADPKKKDFFFRKKRYSYLEA